MIVARVGAVGRQLFMAYHPASGEVRRSTAVLLCNPFGHESLRAHRVYRVLAERLARSGRPALRFDYHGTGDSDGDDIEADIGEWQADILRADAELRSRSGCSGTAWLGMRMGANLALRATTSTSTPPRGLVLWEPIADGRAYLDELRTGHMRYLEREFNQRWSRLAGAAGRPAAGPEDEALGFPLPAPLRQGIAEIANPSSSPLQVPWIRAGASDVTGIAQAWFESWRADAPDAGWLPANPDAVWNSDGAMESAVLPQALVEWLRCQLEALP
jgi:hypothetical protein